VAGSDDRKTARRAGGAAYTGEGDGGGGGNCRHDWGLQPAGLAPAASAGGEGNKRGRGWQGQLGRQRRRATAAGETEAAAAAAMAERPATRAGGGSQRRRGRRCQRARGQRALCKRLRPQ